MNDFPPSALQSSSLINTAHLQARLGVARGRFDVDALAECASTSSLLLERAARGAPAGSVIVADRQIAGRGRRGRNWYTSAESGLTFSLLWRFDCGVERLAGLSLAVGVAVARALEKCGVSGVGLKWPNDILLSHDGVDAKLGGILVELQSEQRQSEPRRMLAVIGIGINLHLPKVDDLPEAMAHPVAGLAQVLSPLPARDELLANLLIELAAVLDRFSAGGFAAVRDEWLGRHVWQDRPVRLLQDGLVQMEGRCVGVDADGALLIETPAGLERCLSGDVSLRVK